MHPSAALSHPACHCCSHCHRSLHHCLHYHMYRRCSVSHYCMCRHCSVKHCLRNCCHFGCYLLYFLYCLYLHWKMLNFRSAFLSLSPSVFWFLFRSVFSNSFLETTLEVLSIVPSFFIFTGITSDFSPSFSLLSIIFIIFISAKTNPFILKCSLSFCSISSSVISLVLFPLSILGSTSPKYNIPAGIKSLSWHTASK